MPAKSSATRAIARSRANLAAISLRRFPPVPRADSTSPPRRKRKLRNSAKISSGASLFSIGRLFFSAW
jgi:hypothetical protein